MLKKIKKKKKNLDCLYKTVDANKTKSQTKWKQVLLGGAELVQTAHFLSSASFTVVH